MDSSPGQSQSITLDNRLLAETVRLYEDAQGFAIDEPQALERGRAAGGDLERRIILRSQALSITPALKTALQQLRNASDRRDQSKQAAAAVAEEAAAPAAYDPAAAERLFQTKCSQCHDTTLVASSPPGSEGEARELVAQMVEEGLEATQEELAHLVRYLTESYAKSTE